MPGESANGDQWIVQERADGIRVAIIDGLGHGPDAEIAAMAAIKTLRADPALDPQRALLTCDTALRGTRGAAVSIIAIYPERGVLQFAGIGNVEGHLLGSDEIRMFSPARGIVGRGGRTPQLLEFRLERRWAVILFSDGIRARDMRSVTLDAPADELAHQILERSARATDDATVVVVHGDVA